MPGAIVKSALNQNAANSLAYNVTVLCLIYYCRSHGSTFDFFNTIGQVLPFQTFVSEAKSQGFGQQSGLLQSCSTRTVLLSAFVLRPGKGHKAYGDNGARLRLPRCDLFDDRELLHAGRESQRHDEQAAHFELLDQRRRDMPECSCHDNCIERAALRPAIITVANLYAHIVITEAFERFRGGLAKRTHNLNGTDPSHQPR